MDIKDFFWLIENAEVLPEGSYRLLIEAPLDMSENVEEEPAAI